MVIFSQRAQRWASLRASRPTVFAIALIAATAMADTAFGQAQGEPQSIARGEALAVRNCAGCHAIGPKGDSPNPSAPPFRDVQKRSPQDLEAGVLSDLIAGHPSMPEFRLQPAEVHDLLMYLRSLGSQKAARAGSAHKG